MKEVLKINYLWNISSIEQNFIICQIIQQTNKCFLYIHWDTKMKIKRTQKEGPYLTQCLTSFSSIDHLFCLCARFLIPFHLTQMRFSPSTHLLIRLSLETLISIIRIGLPILVELIDLVNSVIFFLSQMTLLKWLTFLLGSQTVILIVLLFWTYFFLLTLVFVLQWLFLDDNCCASHCPSQQLLLGKVLSDLIWLF